MPGAGRLDRDAAAGEPMTGSPPIGAVVGGAA